MVLSTHKCKPLATLFFLAKNKTEDLPNKMMYDIESPSYKGV